MNELLVSKCLDILNVFHARNGQDLWVNEIARRVTNATGSKDTPKIKESIKLLERALIIQAVSSKYKQKEMKVLTPLGQEVSNFADDLKKCSYNYTRLRQTIIENNISIGNTENLEEAEKIEERKLLAKGWTHLDIQHMFFIMKSAFAMEKIYRNNIFNSILYRYSVIRSDHEVNEMADKIIQKIMLNEIQSLFILTRGLGEVGSVFDEYPETSDDKDIPFVDLYNLIYEQLDEYYTRDSTLLNKSISLTIEEVTLSLFLLLQPDDEDVQYYIKELDRVANIQEEEVLLRIKKKDQFTDSSRSIFELSLLKLRNIYLKYLDIKRKKVY